MSRKVHTMSAAEQGSYYPGEVAEDQGKSLADYLGILGRRRAWVLGVSGTLFVAALGVALALPPVFRSTATILIQEQEIPQELVRSTVTSFADERIQVISQQVMTRSVLLDLVDKYGLYGSARQRDTSEEILDRMRRDIKLVPISADVTDRRTGSQIKSTIAFTLSFESEVAASAQKIANELTTLFLNENVKNRQQKAAETSSFLQEELDRLNKHISEVEQRLADFKRRNQGRLPELNIVNQQSSDRTENELLRNDRDIQTLEERKILLEGQLAQLKPANPIVASGSGGVVLEPEDRLKALQSQLASLVGVYSEEHPDVKRMRREVASLKTQTGTDGASLEREARLAELEAQLSVLRQKYSDDHPDVVRMRRSLAAIRDAVDAEVRAGRLPASKRDRKPDNPFYITLKAQIDTTVSEIASLRAMRKELQAKMNLLETRMLQTPEVEREYLELARDQESSRTRFRELREKQMQAQVAEQLERGRKAERFTLIDPPVYPEKPFRPNRSAIVLLGSVLALAGGFGAAAVREATDRTVHGTREAVRLLRVPVLAVIPRVNSPGALRRRTLRKRIWLLAATGLVVCVAVALHFFVMPVDVAWYALLRRLAL
jgi:succinoglycan biosynthesis transport protein ExoP